MNTLARAKATSFAGDMKPVAERDVSDAPSVLEAPRPSDAAFQPLAPFEPLLSAARRQLATERLIADMGMQVVAVDAPHIDEAVAEGLAQLGGALQVDRVVLWRKALDGASSEATHHWSSGADSTPAATRPLAIPSSVKATLEAGELACFSNLSEVTSPGDRDILLRDGIRSVAFVPVELPGETTGVRRGLMVASTIRIVDWSPALVGQLRLASLIFGHALARQATVNELQWALDELAQMRVENIGALHELGRTGPQGRRSPDVTRAEPGAPDCQPDLESVELRREVRALKGTRLLAAESPAARHVLAQIEQVAPTTATVLLFGQTGSGKEVFAEAMHDLSPRRNKRMIRVNCAAIPTSLIESELFGRERGAYTGALSRQIGRFEAAEGSTLFLDEIGELPLEVQVKLLRVLQDRVIERLGSSQSIKVNLRVIAATNRDLEQAVAEGTFREDLYYRLNVFPIHVPPLRERVEDIPALVWSFIDEFSSVVRQARRVGVEEKPARAAGLFMAGQHPGASEHGRAGVILATDSRLTIDAPRPPLPASRKSLKMVDVECEHMRSVLESTGWRVRGRGGAADLLGMKPTTLESRMAKLGVVRGSSPAAAAIARIA